MASTRASEVQSSTIPAGGSPETSTLEVLLLTSTSTQQVRTSPTLEDELSFKMVQFNWSVMGGNFSRLIFKSDSSTDGAVLGMGKFMGIGQVYSTRT